MELQSIPSLIPNRYRNVIKGLLEDQNKQVIHDILEDIDLDDRTFLRIANMIPSMKTCPIGVLRILAKEPGNTISKRVLKIKEKKGSI